MHAFAPFAGINETKTPVIISKGSIILRILNLGRESSSAAAKVPTFDDARTKPSRKRVRARAAFDNVGGLIAQEVSGGTPKTVRASIQQHHGGGFGLAADLGAGMQAAAAHEQDVRNAIILRSEAKSNRVKEMQELLHMDQGPADPLGNQVGANALLIAAALHPVPVSQTSWWLWVSWIQAFGQRQCTDGGTARVGWVVRPFMLRDETLRLTIVTIHQVRCP